MANIREIAKGLSFFVFVSIMFYFYWTQVFSNIFDLTTGALSHDFIGSISWISFIILYIVCAPLYLVYSFIAGARNDVETKPIEMLKGIAIWIVGMVVVVFLYYIMSLIIPTMSGLNTIDTGATSQFETISWFIVIIGIIGVSVAPYVYILRGYGQNIPGIEEMLKGKEEVNA